MKLIADGFILKREDRSKKDIYFQLIDYSGLANFYKPDPKNLESIVAEIRATYGSDNNLLN